MNPTYFFIIIILFSVVIIALQKSYSTNGIIEGLEWEDQSKYDSKELAKLDSGADYDYPSKIKDPKSIGMSKKGDWDSVERNIVGLNHYVDLLISGKSRAALSGRPLGEKRFVSTEQKCKDSDGIEHDRYFYIDNVPKGALKGLIPAAVSSVGKIDLSELTSIFEPDDKEENECVPLTMQTRNNAHEVMDETHYVTIKDIKSIDPCSFSNDYNSYSEESCSEGYSNINPSFKIPSDNLMKIYFAMTGCLGLYIIFCTLNKRC